MTDDELEELLDADAPEPTSGFDAGFWHRFEQADPEAQVEALVEGDRPRPSAGFDRRMHADLADERGGRLAGSGRSPTRPPLRLRRRGRWLATGVATLAAAALAAAMLLSVTPPELPVETPPENLQLMANLELVETLPQLEVLDAIGDEETFELVAMLHELEGEEGLP